MKHSLPRRKPNSHFYPRRRRQTLFIKLEGLPHTLEFGVSSPVKSGEDTWARLEEAWGEPRVCAIRYQDFEKEGKLQWIPWVDVSYHWTIPKAGDLYGAPCGERVGHYYHLLGGRMATIVRASVYSICVPKHEVGGELDDPEWVTVLDTDPEWKDLSWGRMHEIPHQYWGADDFYMSKREYTRYTAQQLESHRHRDSRALRR